MITNAYGGWTPLRNALRKLDLYDTLAVIRAYSAFKTVRQPNPFPTDMEVCRSVYSDERLILPWEMEILAREAIIVCSPEPSAKHTARKWDTFANLINKLRELDNYISRYLVDAKKILPELTVRVNHLQTKYQTERPSKSGLIRYSRIFGHPAVEPILKAKIGLSSKQLFTIGAGLWLMYASQYFCLYYPLDIQGIADITPAEHDKFIQLYSLPMKTMEQRLRAERKLDDTFMYQFHALQSYPLIFTEFQGRPGHICPIPTLLFWRITSGLFYDLIKERGFDQAFGTSFQEYVGDMLKKTLDSTSTTIYPEEPDSRFNRSDWIIDQTDAFMLVECKTKRLTIEAKTTILDLIPLQDQLEVLAKAVVQSYQALEAYKNGKYRSPLYSYNPAKQPFICVVTLENWRLMGPEIEQLRGIVRDRLIQVGLDATLMEQAPFVTCAVNEMEEFAYLLKTNDLADIVRKYWDDPEKSSWPFISYLSNSYKEEFQDYKYIFADELENVFTIELTPQKDAGS